MITRAESDAWRPGLTGWSTDILQFYSDVAAELPDGATCVELGVWCGRSLSYLDFALRRAGKTHCRLVGVDAWPEGYGARGGSPIDEAIQRVGGGSLYVWAMSEMLKYIPEHLAHLDLVRCRTTLAARLFDNASLDLVFVDADHEYAGVLLDLTAWTPKVRRGGILAGHDYDHAHPLHSEVVRAVDDFFGRDNITMPVGPIPDASVWRRK